MTVFQFRRLPVDLNAVWYFYYYGNTEFAFTDGKANNYDGYSQGLHGGIDFGHSGGGANVYAGVDGIFDYGGDKRAFTPNRVDILVGRFRILYGHLVNLNPALQHGQAITADTLIGQVSSQTNHTHLEVRESDTYIRNPLLFFPDALRNQLMTKFPPKIGGDFGFHAWDHWTSPFDQPRIKLGGPVIGPRATAPQTDFTADRVDGSSQTPVVVPVTPVNNTPAPVAVVGFNAGCDGFTENSRLTKGGQARVIPHTAPNAIKTEPGKTTTHPNSIKIAEIPPGDSFTVLDGPVCADTVLWWKVNYNGTVGWTGEGTANQYWVEPLPDAAPVVVQPPVAKSTTQIMSTQPVTPPSTVDAGSTNTESHVPPNTVVTACPGFNLPTRLSVGIQAQVIPGFGSNIMKSEPAKTTTRPTSVRVGDIPPGTVVKVVDGPACSDNVLWWKVDFNGVVGWTGEGQADAYWMQPVTADMPASPVPISVPNTIPVPPPAKTRVLVGLHVGLFTFRQEILGMAKRLHDAGKPLGVCKVITDADFANQLAPYTTVLFRQVWDGRERLSLAEFPNNEADAIAYGRAKYNGEHKGPNDAAHAAHYLQFTNELGGTHPFDYAVALGLMMEADAHGRKVAIFGDSTGTPEPSQWVQRIPALRYAMAHGHAVVLNEYSPWANGQPSSLPVSSGNDFVYNGGRHRTLYAAVPADCRPKLIIGETGPSDATYRGDGPLVADMRAYNQMLQADDYVIGYCWFTAGKSFQSPTWEINAGLGAIEQLVLGLPS